MAPQNIRCALVLTEKETEKETETETDEVEAEFANRKANNYDYIVFCDTVLTQCRLALWTATDKESYTSARTTAMYLGLTVVLSCIVVASFHRVSASP